MSWSNLWPCLKNENKNKNFHQVCHRVNMLWFLVTKPKKRYILIRRTRIIRKKESVEVDDDDDQSKKSSTWKYWKVQNFKTAKYCLFLFTEHFNIVYQKENDSFPLWSSSTYIHSMILFAINKFVIGDVDVLKSHYYKRVISLQQQQQQQALE